MRSFDAQDHDYGDRRYRLWVSRLGQSMCTCLLSDAGSKGAGSTFQRVKAPPLKAWTHHLSKQASDSKKTQHNKSLQCVESDVGQKTEALSAVDCRFLLFVSSRQ